MDLKNSFDINIDKNLPEPKYRQIVSAVQKKIDTGEIKKGDRIPSLNWLCNTYGLSQDTVLAAYNDLKSKGIISSQVGKGYFVRKEQMGITRKILLLFDKLTAYKEELYESFKRELGNSDEEQIFFHHNNLKLFQTILEGAAGEFTEYVIMPMPGREAAEIVSHLPKRKIYILDQGRVYFKNKYPSVCQDFERDIYRILKKNIKLVNKYNRLILVIRHRKAHYRLIIKGFNDFGRQIPIESLVVNDLKKFNIKQGDAYIAVDDRDLEFLVRYSIKNKAKLGVDIGLLSYNEIPMKSIISTGISTISTDFAQMGKSIAKMILEKQRENIDNPFNFIDRKSF